LAQIFGAQVVDVSPSSLLFSITGEPRKLNDFLELLRPFGLVEMAKSGRIALSRDAKSRRGKGN
jgi:acetolactate synthase-1/3 small subunit